MSDAPTRSVVERTLIVSTTVDTLDEALTFAVQVLDTHQYDTTGYRIEILSATNEDDDDDHFFEVSVQGLLKDNGS